MAMAVATTMSVAGKGVMGASLAGVHHSQVSQSGSFVQQSCLATKLRKSNVMCAASSGREEKEEKDWVRSGMVAIGAAAVVLLSNEAPNLAMAEEGDPQFQTYYGTAASASSYGGYGGNANKKDSAEYIFDVPQVLIVFSDYLRVKFQSHLKYSASENIVDSTRKRRF